MDVRLPRLGEGADSGAVASIFVKAGDQVTKDQPILELESEKAVASIPSPADGTVVSISVKEGDVIRVGALLLTLSAGDGGSALPGQPPAQAFAPALAPSPAQALAQAQAPARSPAAPQAGPQAAQLPAESHETPPQAFREPPHGMPPAASPSLRKTARELGIDLARVRGSERGGRIVLADLRRYIESLQAPAAVKAPVAAVAPAVDFAKWGGIERKKLTTLRSTISGRMAASWANIPHVTQFDSADITDLLAVRKKHAAAYEKAGAHLTLTAFALKVLAPVLARHRIFNASLDEAQGEIVYKNYFHAGIAVDTEQGLIVPVIRNVEAKSLLELATELHALAERTRQRKVGLEEMQGGSFTISNQGGIGSGHFTPIINRPEVAILGIGKGILRPVVREKSTIARMMLPLSLSYDHRIIDGADAARFMVELVGAFESITESEVKLK